MSSCQASNINEIPSWRRKIPEWKGEELNIGILKHILFLKFDSENISIVRKQHQNKMRQRN